ncbi:hypothetical protein PCL_06548 [Purpureocillium lilacinum]|uniref:Uncharacterized protein n=1 Tax=Purpureocillium lilacinum TaxID=33203 RepID=A0A2U3EN49_PURLI|nr:hypothetical protein Purlil1_8585 [Purpureocillium lilacinum]PWI75890.1 hypothetical protein PCL_06548 [Purpureocillium lilacinum]
MWRGVPFNSGLRKDLPLPLDAIPAAARAGLLATARAARTAQQVRPCLVWRTNLRVSSGLAWVPSRSPQDVFPPRLANAQRVSNYGPIVSYGTPHLVPPSTRTSAEDGFSACHSSAVTGLVAWPSP